MEVSAVDLAEVGEADSFNIGDSIRVIAKPFAVDQRLYLTQIQRDIQNIDKNTITLSGHVTRRSLTSQMLSVTDAIEDLPSESDILKAAKRNALAMLLDETQGGYVVYEYDSNNAYMTAINICNARTIEASTKRWRWSQNGFGYMHRDNINQAWSNLAVAITIDGAIVANFITSGTLDASKATITNINASNINTGTLNGNNVTVTNLSASNITSGTLNGNNVNVTNINASNINSGTLNGNTVSVTNLSASNITGGSMSADRISGGTISSSNISSTDPNHNNTTTKITGGQIEIETGSGGENYLTLKESGSTLQIGGNKVAVSKNGQYIQLNWIDIMNYLNSHI